MWKDPCKHVLLSTKSVFTWLTFVVIHMFVLSPTSCLNLGLFVWMIGFTVSNDIFGYCWISGRQLCTTKTSLCILLNLPRGRQLLNDELSLDVCCLHLCVCVCVALIIHGGFCRYAFGCYSTQLFDLRLSRCFSLLNQLHLIWVAIYNVHNLCPTCD